MDAMEHQEITGLSQKLCKISSKGKAAEVSRERIVQGEILVADVQLFPLNNLATLSEVSRMSAAVLLWTGATGQPVPLGSYEYSDFITKVH